MIISPGTNFLCRGEGLLAGGLLTGGAGNPTESVHAGGHHSAPHRPWGVFFWLCNGV